MWIPKKVGPTDEHVRLNFQLVADLYRSFDVLVELYRVIQKSTKSHVPEFVNVSTTNQLHNGIIVISCLQAYWANKNELLGEEESKAPEGNKIIRLDNSVYFRKLNMKKLYELALGPHMGFVAPT